MNRLALAAPLLVFLCVANASAQRFTQLKTDYATTSDRQKAVVLLKRLEQKVIVYRSLGDFEDNGKLARVPLKDFEAELQNVTRELEVTLARMPASQLRTQVVNSLASYRDGTFWWQKIDQPRVVDVSALRYEFLPTLSDTALNSSIPYNVAIHWRQAARYLARAEELLARE
jgi:hypothetical protein